VWSLPRDNRAVQDEVLLAQLLAGHRIDDTDAVLPMKTDAMESAWTKLRAQTTLENGVRSPIFVRKAPSPAVEEDYYVPGEDTETSTAWRRYSGQMGDVARQVNPDLPYPSSLSPALSNQLAGLLEVSSKAIEADPDPQHGGFYHVRAYVYERLGQYQQAISDMREWLWRIGPIPNRHFLVKQYFVLGRCYWRLGEKEKADTYLERAQECASEDADSCDFLALSYATGPSNLCSVEKALPFALRAVALSKTNLSCSATLAEIYSRSGQSQKAADILEKALELHPNSGAQGALICNNLAWNYSTGPKEIRSPKKALPLALKAIALGGTNQNGMNTLGVVYYRLGQLTNAVEVFERNTQQESGPVTACDRLFLAMSYYRLGETTKAESVFAKATKWLIENPDQEDQEMRAFRAEAEEVLGKRKSNTQNLKTP